jgi:hypothetical protein
MSLFSARRSLSAIREAAPDAQAILTGATDLPATDFL